LVLLQQLVRQLADAVVDDVAATLRALERPLLGVVLDGLLEPLQPRPQLVPTLTLLQATVRNVLPGLALKFARAHVAQRALLPLCQHRLPLFGNAIEQLVELVRAGVRVLARRQHDAVAEAGELYLLAHVSPTPTCGRSGTTTASSGGWTMRSTSAASLASAAAFSGAKPCTL